MSMPINSFPATTGFFVFDVESIGLHGEGFAVAGGVYDRWSIPVNDTEFCFACPPGNAKGVPGREQEDRDWLQANVPFIEPTHDSPFQVRHAFWSHLRRMQRMHGAIMFAECGWPVEARFLLDCINDDPLDRVWKGPYPLHEVSSVMATAGMDPMKTYDRTTLEQPAHHPLADARLSARLLSMALDKIP